MLPEPAGVAHEEAAAHQVFAHLGALSVGQAPMPDLDRSGAGLPEFSGGVRSAFLRPLSNLGSCCASVIMEMAMTIEERFERIEHVTAGLAEERRKDREEFRALWRDTQRQLNELTIRVVEVDIR